MGCGRRLPRSEASNSEWSSKLDLHFLSLIQLLPSIVLTQSISIFLFYRRVLLSVYYVFSVFIVFLLSLFGSLSIDSRTEHNQTPFVFCLSLSDVAHNANVQGVPGF